MVEFVDTDFRADMGNVQVNLIQYLLRKGNVEKPAFTTWGKRGRDKICINNFMDIPKIILR